MNLLKRVFQSEIKGIDDKEQTLTAYVSTGGRDRMDEVLLPAGVDLKNYNKNPVVLWAHRYDQPPIGKALWTKRSGEGILSKVKFASTQFAQDIFKLYKDGFLKAFSVGFIPKEHEDGDGQKSPRRTYKKWEMLEYSAVPVPANPDALTLAVQKGIVSDTTVKELEIPEDNTTETITDDTTSYTSAPEIGAAPSEEEEPAPEPVEANKGFEEMAAEITILNEKLEAAEKENTELRYKLYTALESKSKLEQEPEITVDKLATLVVESVNGVIRKHQGRIS